MSAPVLLVGKPWRGGLATYLHAALERVTGGPVPWVRTHPGNTAARLLPRATRAGRLRDRLAATPHQVSVWVNHHAALEDVETGRPRVLWLTDDPRPVLDRLGGYDRVFVSDPGYAPEVAAAAGEAFAGELPFACLPAVHRPVWDAAGAAPRACMIARRDRKRDAHLARVFAAGLRPLIVGNHFLRHALALRHPGCFRPPVPLQGMAAVYARHALGLNVHAAVVRGGTNMRTFECAGYGIPQVVERRPGLERHFDPGREITVYEGLDDLPEVLARALRDPPAAAMAGRAQRRALAEHCYEHRVVRLLEGLAPLAGTA